MPSPTPTLLVGEKLITALIAFINANKGDMLQGLNIVPAFSTAQPSPPYLALWSPEAPVHPDFESLPGGSWPRLVTIELHMKANAKDADYTAQIGKYAAELDEILRTRRTGSESDPREDFTAFIDAANPGGSLHPSSGLFIYPRGIRTVTDGCGIHDSRWHWSRTIEITAQNGDPD